MRTIRTILFEREERELFARVQPLIGVAYPRASDPLTPAGAGVADDDPHLRVLNDLRDNRDAIARHRLVLAAETLTALRDAVSAQADPAYWTTHHRTGTLTATEQSMAAVLVEERARQIKQVQAALDVVVRALGATSVADDPRWWTTQEREA